MTPSEQLFDVFLRRRPIVGWLVAGLVAALAAAVYIAFPNESREFPFITFYPAIVIAAVFGGWLPATAVAAGGWLFGWFFLLPPLNSFTLTRNGAIGVALDAAVSAITIVLVEMVAIAARKARGRELLAESLLAERDTMFRELQHRAANNMQLVASSLSIQARRLPAGDPGRAALEQGAERLVLLARLHRRLHTPQLAARGFEVIAREVLTDLFNGTGCGHITLELRADTIALASDVVTTLVQIAAEVATNAVKHAFGKGLGTRFAVTLRRLADRQAELTFADDGPGFAEATDDAPQGLGRKILESLVDRLDGKLALGNGGGAVVTVTFPIPEDAAIAKGLRTAESRAAAGPSAILQAGSSEGWTAASFDEMPPMRR